MQVVRLDGLSDPRFADRDLYAAIGDDRRLRARDVFVAEGRFVAARLIERHACLVRSLLLNDAAFGALATACSRLGDDVRVFVCDTRDFETVTGYAIHRGCLALASRPRTPAIDELTAVARTLLLIEEVSNADNVGGIFRNAAAFGADGIVLSHGCVDPLYRKAIRTSMAAALSVPFVRVADAEAWRRTLEDVRARGFQTVALTPDAAALDLETFARRRRAERLAILLGAEGAGLTPESQAAAVARVRIPITPGVDSLNVAVAAGIALYRLSAGPSGQ